MLLWLASIWPYRLIRWLVAGVFLYAAFGKLPHLHVFVENVYEFGLVAQEAVFPIALTIIGLEMIAGFGLLLDLRGALGTIAILLVTFIGVLSYGVALNLEIDCGCFGPGKRNAGLHQAIFTDVCLLAACGYLYWSRWMRSSGPTNLRTLWNKIPSDSGSPANTI